MKKLLSVLIIVFIMACLSACGSSDILGEWYLPDHEDPEFAFLEGDIFVDGNDQYKYERDGDTIVVDGGLSGVISFTIGTKDGKDVLIDPTEDSDSDSRYLYRKEDVAEINKEIREKEKASEAAEAREAAKRQEQEAADCEEFAAYLKEKLVGEWEDSRGGVDYEFQKEPVVSITSISVDDLDSKVTYDSEWSVRTFKDSEGNPYVRVNINEVPAQDYTEDVWEFYPADLEAAKEMVDSGRFSQVEDYDESLVLLRK